MFSLQLTAQEILKFDFDSETKPEHLIVEYLLDAETDNEDFYIELYANFPDSTVLLKEVTGDVGPNITAGQNTIDWNYEEEILHYKGNIQFTLRVKYMLQFLNENRIRRGKYQHLILHNSIHKDSIILFLSHPVLGDKIELTYNLSGDTLSYLIPKNVKKKKNYQFYIDRFGEEKDIYSKKFTIKRKYPHFLKVLPVILVGAYLGFDKYAKVTEPLPNPPVDQVE
jgi:hypothetical protein